MLGALCAEVAAAIGTEPRGAWATWQELSPGHYVEGDVAADVQPGGSHPPLVRVIAFEGRPPELIEAMLETAARVLERELGLGEGNVFATYEEARSGRVHDGGRIVR